MAARTEKADPAVIYVTAQICRRTEEEVVQYTGMYGRAPNAIDIS